MDDADESMTALHMPVADILEQLEGIRDSAKRMLTPEPDDIWQADMLACAAAARILRALAGEGLADAEQVLDWLYDYRAQARELQAVRKQLKELQRMDKRRKPYGGGRSGT